MSGSGDRAAFEGRESGLAFLACLVAIAALNHPFVGMPPVWDAAAGVFAPAIHLYESGFDLAGLLAEPGYLKAGPNVHSLSSVTWATALAIAGTGADPSLYLPLLHVLNFAFAAVVGALAFVLTRRAAGSIAAWVATVGVLATPAFRVQTGALHTEIAGAAFVMLALAAWASRRFGWLVAFTLAACSVKSFGLVLVAAFGLGVALDRTLPPRERVLRIGAFAAPAVLLEVARWATAPRGQPARGFGEHLGTLAANVAAVPDLLAILLLAAALAIVGAVRGRGDRTTAAALAIAGLLVVFVVTAPLTGAALHPLPRYLVWVVAPLWVGVASSLATFDRRAVALLVPLAAFAAANQDGRLYPSAEPHRRSFSLAERSLEYLDFFELQRRSLSDLATLTEGRPVFVTRGEYYLLSSPLMGWVAEPLPDARFLMRARYRNADLGNYPDDFFVLDAGSNWYHGQGVIERLVRAVEKSDDRTLRSEREWASGVYRSRLYRVRPQPGPVRSSGSRLQPMLVNDRQAR